MTNINGNTYAAVQVKTIGCKNEIGEEIHRWIDVTALTGFLDLRNGTSLNIPNSSKIEDSTHIFICNYVDLSKLLSGWVWSPFNLHTGVISTEILTDWTWSTFNFYTGVIKKSGYGKTVEAMAENARMLIDGKIYQIQLIDNPMYLNDQLEIYLKCTGGQ